LIVLLSQNALLAKRNHRVICRPNEFTISSQVVYV